MSLRYPLMIIFYLFLFLLTGYVLGRLHFVSNDEIGDGVSHKIKIIKNRVVGVHSKVISPTRERDKQSLIQDIPYE